MKNQRKWKPGGCQRRSTTTPKPRQRQGPQGDKEKERFLDEPPLVLSKRQKKEA